MLAWHDGENTFVATTIIDNTEIPENLTDENIKAGVTVGDVTGTFTSDANATAVDILSGKSAYINGVKIEGAIDVVSPKTENNILTIPDGYV